MHVLCNFSSYTGLGMLKRNEIAKYFVHMTDSEMANKQHPTASMRPKTQGGHQTNPTRERRNGSLFFDTEAHFNRATTSHDASTPNKWKSALHDAANSSLISGISAAGDRYWCDDKRL